MQRNRPVALVSLASTRVVSAVLAAALSTGCGASVSILKPANAIPEERCNVIVYSSLSSAREKGEVEELCMISGTSSGSFQHTVATAIEKHKEQACECGGTNVYVQAQDAGTLGTASVTLVAFRYLQRTTKDSGPNAARKDKCRSKGGTWTDDRCEVPVD